MTIDEFDTLFNRVLLEIRSEPADVIMSRFPHGQVSLEEAMGLILREAEEFTEKLVYRVLAEICVQ